MVSTGKRISAATHGPDLSGGAPQPYVLVHRASSGGQPLFPPLKLKQSVTYIGRLHGNDVVLPSELVSRRHAKLIVSDLGVTVHDLDSHNGIFLNGKKVRSTPVSSGDLLYVGDVCLSIRPAQAGEAVVDEIEGLNKSDLVRRAAGAAELSNEEDPAVRNLAALVRATDLLLGADDADFRVRIVEVCRELTEATIAVFLERRADGILDAPVILRPDGDAQGEPPVSWPVVRRSIDEAVTLFSKDVEKDPLVPNDPLSSSDQGAVMCVPVLGVDRQPIGALYLSRTQAGSGFTDREVETISAIAHLVAARMRGQGTGRGSDAGSASAKQALGDALAAKSKVDLELSSSREDLVAAKSELSSSRSEASAMKAEATAARNDATALKDELAAARTELAALRGDHVRSTTKLQDLEASQKDGASNVQRLDDEKKRLAEALEHQKALSEKTAQKLDEERKQLRAEVDRLAAAVKKAEDEAIRHQSESERLAAQLRSVADQKQGASAEIDAMAAARDAAVADQRSLADELAKSKSDADRAREDLGRALSDISQTKADLAQSQAELERAAAELTDANGELERASAALAAAVQDGDHKVEEALKDVEIVGEELAGLREALKYVTPKALGARLESLGEGTEIIDQLSARLATTLYVALSGCDGWAAKAGAEDVKTRLDRFCAAVGARAKANGGEVAGVLGHAHLVTFSPDAAGVRGALRCALEVAALVPLDAVGGVQAGLHMSTTMTGFCGDGPGAVLVEVGEAVAVARGAAEWAQPGTVYATDAVRGLLAGDPAFMLIGAGPSLIRGVSQPVNLYLVSRAEGMPT